MSSGQHAIVHAVGAATPSPNQRRANAVVSTTISTPTATCSKATIV
jgi:hypothetical protein